MFNSLNLILLAIVVYCIYEGNSIRRNMKKKTFNIYREFTKLVFFMYFLAIFSYTFFPMHIRPESIFIINFVPIEETISMFSNNVNLGIYNVLGNTLMFVPLGIFIPLLFKKRDNIISIIFYGFTGSLFIEINQLMTGGRTADIDDVIFNTVGALLGYIIYKVLVKYVSKIKEAKMILTLIGNGETKVVKKSLAILLPIFIALQLSVIYAKNEMKDMLLVTEAEIVEAFNMDSSRRIVFSKEIDNGRVYLVNYKYEDDEQLGLEYYEKQNETEFMLKESFSQQVEKDKKGNFSYATIITRIKPVDTLVVFGEASGESKLKVSTGDISKTIDIKEKGCFLEVIDITNEKLAEEFEVKTEFLK